MIRSYANQTKENDSYDWQENIKTVDFEGTKINSFKLVIMLTRNEREKVFSVFISQRVCGEFIIYLRPLLVFQRRRLFVKPM